MTTVTLEFRAPESRREILDHELDLLLSHLEPLAAWLARVGGELRMDGMPLMPRRP